MRRPDGAYFAIAFSDYRVNSGLPDSLFARSDKGVNGIRLRVKTGGGKGRKS